MKLPTLEQAVCATGKHCRACRERGEKGDRFRARLQKQVALSATWPECPNGVAWDYDPPHPSRGLGDTIAKITKAVGVKPCGGCAKRQAALNRLVPYRK